MGVAKKKKKPGTESPGQYVAYGIRMCRMGVVMKSNKQLLFQTLFDNVNRNEKYCQNN